jgi:hypothetical protein
MTDVTANVEVKDNGASSTLNRIAASSKSAEDAFGRLIGKADELGRSKGAQSFSKQANEAFTAVGHKLDEVTGKVQVLKERIGELHSKNIEVSVEGLDEAIIKAETLKRVLDDIDNRNSVGSSTGTGALGSSDAAVVRSIEGLRADLRTYASGGGPSGPGSNFSAVGGGFGGGEGAGFGGFLMPGLMALGIGAAPGIASSVAGLGAGLIGGAGAAGLAYSAALPAAATAKIISSVGKIASTPITGAIASASQSVQSIQQMQLTDPQSIAQLQLQQSQQQALTATSNQQQLAALAASGQGPGTEAYAAAVGQMETTARLTQVQNQQAIAQQRQSQQQAISQARQLEAETLRQTYGIDPTQVMGVANRYQGLQLSLGQTFAGGERGNQTFGAINGALGFAQNSGIKILGQQWNQFFPVIDQGLMRLEKFGSSKAGQDEISYWTENLPSIASGAENVAAAVAKLGGNLTADLAPLTEHFETGLAGFFGRSADWAGSTEGITTINQAITASAPVWSGFARVAAATGKGIDSLLVNGGSQLAARGLNDLASDIPDIVRYMERGVATVEGLGPEVKQLEQIVGSAFGPGGGFGAALTVTKGLLDVLQALTGVLGPAGTRAALASAFAYRSVSSLTKGGGLLSGVLGIGGGAAAEGAAGGGGIRARLAGSELLGTVRSALPLALTGTILAQSGGLTGTVGDSLLGYAGFSSAGKLLAARGVQINGLSGVSTAASRATGELTDAGYSAAEIAEGGGAEALLEGLGGAADASGVGLPLGLALGAAGVALPFLSKLFGGGGKKKPAVASTPPQQYGSLTSFSDLSQYLGQSFTGQVGSTRTWIPTTLGPRGTSVPGHWSDSPVSGVVGYGTPGAGYGDAKQQQEQKELQQAYMSLQQTTSQQANSMGELEKSYGSYAKQVAQVKNDYAHTARSASQLRTEHQAISTLLGEQKSTLQQMSQIDPFSVNYNRFGAATSKNSGAISTLLSIGRGSSGVAGLASTQATLSSQAASVRSAGLAVLAATPVGNRASMAEALASGSPDQLAAVLGQTPRNSALRSALQSYSKVAQGGTYSEVQQELTSIGTSFANLSASQRRDFNKDVSRNASYSTAYGAAGTLSASSSSTSVTAGASGGHAVVAQYAGAMKDARSKKAVTDATTEVASTTASGLTSTSSSGAVRETGHQYALAVAGGMTSGPSTSALNAAAGVMTDDVVTQLGAPQALAGSTAAGSNLAESFASGLRDAAQGGAGSMADNAMFNLGYSIARSVSRGAAAGASGTGGDGSPGQLMKGRGGGSPGSNVHHGPRGGATVTPAAGSSGGMVEWDKNANRDSMRNTPYVWGGGHANSGADGFDCSGILSRLLMEQGIIKAPMLAADFMSFGSAGPGSGNDAVTIYASSGHVFCYFDGQYYGAGSLPYGKGATTVNSQVLGAGYSPAPFRASFAGYKTRHITLKGAGNEGDSPTALASSVRAKSRKSGGKSAKAQGDMESMGSSSAFNGGGSAGGPGMAMRGGRRVASSSQDGMRPIHVEIYIHSMHANDDGEYHRTLSKLTKDFKQAMLTSTQTPDTAF